MFFHILFHYSCRMKEMQSKGNVDRLLLTLSSCIFPLLVWSSCLRGLVKHFRLLYSSPSLFFFSFFFSFSCAIFLSVTLFDDYFKKVRGAWIISKYYILSFFLSFDTKKRTKNIRNWLVLRNDSVDKFLRLFFNMLSLVKLSVFLRRSSFIIHRTIPTNILIFFILLIDWWMDFNGMSTRSGLFQA